MSWLIKLSKLLSGRADVVLAVVVVAIVAMMVLPLPTLLVDALIGLNLSVAALLLMLAIYLPSPLAFSTFPAILLLSTLFRLALSISTTRLILLQGDAGSIVLTFGDFVAGGNLVVGLVVFLILTLVQFIVITKGSERVAEVCARFSLDAMPGKQMSIDGDLRAGVTDGNEARQRRQKLELESQFHGAMDGAMKFVKGDAIAGLIIVAVNLIGGMAVGVMQAGLPVAEAAQLYSILTIGDGLVAQIPALFISITAGIIVTRVSSDNSSNVGKDIASQLLAEPRALYIAGGIALGFATVPGMPVAVFLFLGCGLLLLGWRCSRAQHQLPDERGQAQPGSGCPSQGMARVQLLLAQEQWVALEQHELSAALKQAHAELEQFSGLILPVPAATCDRDLAAGCYRILIDAIPGAEAQLPDASLLVLDDGSTLAAAGIGSHNTVHFSGQPASWVAQQHQPQLERLGLPWLAPAQVLARQIKDSMGRYLAEFIGIQETHNLLTALESRHPNLVKEVQRVIAVPRIAEILQRLVAEGIAIVNMRAVLEALAEWGQKEKDPVMLTEYVRLALKRQIVHQHAQGGQALQAYLLTPRVEEKVRQAVRQTSAGSYLALDPASSGQLQQAIRQAVGELAAHAVRPVLVTAMDIRRYVRKLVEQDYYDLAVLSFQELPPELEVRPLARIDMG